MGPALTTDYWEEERFGELAFKFLAFRALLFWLMIRRSLEPPLMLIPC